MGCWNKPIYSVTKATEHFNREKRLFGAQFTNLALHLAVFIIQISLGSSSFTNFSIFSNIFLNAISMHHDRLKGQAHDLNVLIIFKNLLLCWCYSCILFFSLFLFCQYILGSKSFHQNCFHPLHLQNLIIMENMPSSIFHQHCRKRQCALARSCITVNPFILWQ